MPVGLRSFYFLIRPMEKRAPQRVDRDMQEARVFKRVSSSRPYLRKPSRVNSKTRLTSASVL